MYKPLIPFDAKSIGNFFTLLLLMAMIIGSGVVHFTLSNPNLPRLFDLKSLPNNPNNDNRKDGWGLGKELNYEIGLFRYFPTNSDDTLIQDENQKISDDRKVRLSTYWEPSIPGVLVTNVSSFEEQKVQIIKKFSTLCDDTTIPANPPNTPSKEFSSIYFECCGMPQDADDKNRGEIIRKKEAFIKGRTCIPINKFWKHMRQSSKHKISGKLLEGNDEGLGFNPSVQVFGRYEHISRLLKDTNSVTKESHCFKCVENRTKITAIDADLACGPFLNADRGYDALFNYIDKKNPILKRIKSVIRDENGGYVMIFWTVIFILVINYMYKKNTIYTQRIASSERETSLRNQANALLYRSNELQRKLDLKKRQAAAAVGMK